MIEEEIKIIKESWEDVAKRPGEDINILLYQRLADYAPALPCSYQNDLRGNCRRIIIMHNYLINKLDNANFIHDVRSMGKKYSEEGITPGDLEQIKKAIFWALQKKLQDKWTPSVMVSWVWYFSILESIIKDS
jgi:hemoglobin-like flavoprotein